MAECISIKWAVSIDIQILDAVNNLLPIFRNIFSYIRRSHYLSADNLNIYEIWS